MTSYALLLTDVVDSTALAERLGDAAMAALWAKHDRVARDLLPVHRGREIDKTDGFLLLFDVAEHAAAYALAYHQAIEALGLKARAGLHVGPVILTANAAADVARGAKPLEVDGLAKPIAARVMSVARGGQTLSTVAVGPRVESHGHWRMKGVAEPIELFEVGDADAPFTPPPDGAKVYRVVRDGPHWLPVRQVAHALPSERDTFVGRGADLRQLSRLLDDGARLVSVLGIGGTGKTRLVTHYGWTWLGDWPGGVWFCDLSEARSADGVVSAVARALDVPLGKDDPVVQLGHAIAGRGRCLVLLDNFEQVARHAAETLGHWLDRAHEAVFVVTTREVLGLAGEQALPMAPLVDDEGVDLFVDRARQAKPTFVPDDLDAIRALVKLLDGLPLAIELAAARVRVMPPKMLLQRMSERFKLLASAGGRHTRQATLRGALDWSWDLLSPDEQGALAQLSVFEGGFTLEAAEGVLSLSELWPMDAVQALVDKSLVRQVSDDRSIATRFDLLVSVQEYAGEKLEASGGRSEAEARHAAWFAQLGSDEAIEALCTHGCVARLEALVRERDNLLVACRRAVRRGDVAGAVGTVFAALAALELTGPVSLGVELTDAVLALPLSRLDRARVGRRRALMARRVGRSEEARAGLERSLAELLELGDREREVSLRSDLANLSRLQGRMEEARAGYERALTIADALGDRVAQASVWAGLGLLHKDQGRLDEAGRCYELALAVQREVGDLLSEANTSGNLGNLYSDLGQLERARAYAERAYAIAVEVGDRWLEGTMLGNLARLWEELGRADEARETNQRALRVHREVGNRLSEGLVLGNLANLDSAEGRMAESIEGHRAALAIHREVGNQLREGIALGNLGQLYLPEGRADEAREHLTEALALHRALGFTQGLGFWLWGLAQLEAAAGSDRWAPLIDEAVAVSAPYVAAHAEALAVRAELRLGAGDLAGARADVDAARPLVRAGRVAAIVALADARTCHAEARPDAARAALREAEDLAASVHMGPASIVGRALAGVRARLER